MKHETGVQVFYVADNNRTYPAIITQSDEPDNTYITIFSTTGTWPKKVKHSDAKEPGTFHYKTLVKAK